MGHEEELGEIAAAFECLGLPEHATAHEVHAAYRNRLDVAREAGDGEQLRRLREAYALLRRRPGSGGSSFGPRTPRPKGATPPPPPKRGRRTASGRPSVTEVLEFVDQGRYEEAVRRVCSADWHQALTDRGRWEDALIRLACATRWTAPGAFKQLHDHHGAILSRPALGHLAHAYIAIAETTTAWTGWHEFREPDPRLEAFFVRSLCGTLAARRALLAQIGEWLARDRASFIRQLEGIASLSDRLLELLELMCDQLRDDLRVDLPALVDPERVGERLERGFPPSARAVGVGVAAGGTVLGGPRAFLPSLFGGGLLASFAERLVSVMMSTRRREALLDLCLKEGVSVQGLAEWSARQGPLSRARPWADALASDQVLRVAYAFERLVRGLHPARQAN
jgi:hypothetical protein